MLILSRKENESIHIGNDIVIKVVSVEKGNVKIGIEAPENMLILRDELVKAVQDENIKAVTKIEDGDAKVKSLLSRIKKNI